MSDLASPSPAEKKVPEKNQVSTKPPNEINKKAGQKVEKKKPKPPFSPPSLYLRLAIAGVLGLILIGGIFFSALQLKTLVEGVEEKRGQMVALEKKEEDLKLLSLALGSVKEEIPLIEGALPNEEGVVDFIQKVEELGKEVAVENFSFDSDQPQSDQAGNNYIDWTIEASGLLTDLGRFLENLQNLPILVKLKIVDIDQMDQEMSRLIVKARLYVNSDFFSPDARKPEVY